MERQKSAQRPCFDFKITKRLDSESLSFGLTAEC